MRDSKRVQTRTESSPDVVHRQTFPSRKSQVHTHRVLLTGAIPNLESQESFSRTNRPVSSVSRPIADDTTRDAYVIHVRRTVVKRDRDALRRTRVGRGRRRRRFTGYGLMAF